MTDIKEIMADAALLDRLAAEEDGAARLSRALAIWRAKNLDRTDESLLPAAGRWRQTGEAVQSTNWMWPGVRALHL
jgi:hypothetical protein